MKFISPPSKGPRKGWLSYAFGLLNRSNYFIRSYLWWKWKSFCEGCRHLFRPSTRGRWKLVLSKANFFTQCNQRICPRPIWSLLAGSVGHFETTSSVAGLQRYLTLEYACSAFLNVMDCLSVILSFINSPPFSSGTNVLLFNPDSYRHLPSIYSVFSHYGYWLCCSSTPYKYNK